jgi:hypothetical protein
MTRASRLRNDIWRWLLSTVFLLIGIGCSQVHGAQELEKKMAINEMNLWQMITALANAIPFTKSKIETLLSMNLRQDSENEYFQFWKSGRILLKDGLTIESVDLRTKRQEAHPGFLVIEIAGVCIPKVEIQRHYSNLALTEAPRGRSLQEQTVHSSSQSWGELSFGFKEANPACLSTVIFNPKG